MPYLQLDVSDCGEYYLSGQGQQEGRCARLGNREPPVSGPAKCHTPKAREPAYLRQLYLTTTGVCKRIVPEIDNTREHGVFQPLHARV